MQKVGAELREARLARGLSIEDVGNITKIPHASLAALEDGNMAGLPAPVFVRGFIRAYAQVVRLDPGALIRQVPELTAPAPTPTRAPHSDDQFTRVVSIEESKGPVRFRPSHALLFILAAGMVIAAWVMVGQRTSPAASESVMQEEVPPVMHERVDGVSSTFPDAHGAPGW